MRSIGRIRGCRPPGYVIDFTRPHVGSYACLKSSSEPLLYCRSPSASTASKSPLTSTFDVESWRQAVEVPVPLWKLGSLGSHAMSPAAAMTTLFDAVAISLRLFFDRFLAASRARTRYM